MVAAAAVVVGGGGGVWRFGFRFFVGIVRFGGDTWWEYFFDTYNACGLFVRRAPGWRI